MPTWTKTNETQGQKLESFGGSGAYQATAGARRTDKGHGVFSPMGARMGAMTRRSIEKPKATAPGAVDVGRSDATSSASPRSEGAATNQWVDAIRTQT